MRVDAGNADLGRDRRVCTDVHVVRHLDQVVELDAIFDHGVVERPAVDAGVGADLDVVADHHGAQLLDLFPAAIDRREAETVGADHHAAVQDAARTDRATVAESRVRMQAGVFADARLGTDVRLCTDDRRRADLRAGAHEGQRTDVRGCGDSCRGVDDGTGVHASVERRARDGASTTA